VSFEVENNISGFTVIISSSLAAGRDAESSVTTELKLFWGQWILVCDTC